MEAPETPPLIWVLTDGRAGTDNQALGVAEKLGYPFEEKWLHYGLGIEMPNWLAMGTSAGIDLLQSGFYVRHPDLVISAGRRAARAAAYLKRKGCSYRRILVQIMKPEARDGLFSILAIPAHDSFDARPGKESKILRPLLTPHRLTETKLAAARAAWEPRFGRLPHPRLAVLVGGGSKHAAFTPGDARDLIAKARALVTGSALLVTASRRSGEAVERALKETLGPQDFFYSPREGGENPYLGLLACASGIVATADSLSMLSEAAFTGKPLYVYRPAKLGTKHARFLDGLVSHGLARPLDATAVADGFPPAAIAPRSLEILDSAKMIAWEIRALLDARAPVGYEIDKPPAEA